MRALVCKVLNHDWEKRSVKSLLKPQNVIGVCTRCGNELYSHEVLSLGGRDVPDELMSQDDVDKLRAMYRDGEIDREMFELGIGAALGDEQAAAELEKNMELCD